MVVIGPCAPALSDLHAMSLVPVDKVLLSGSVMDWCSELSEAPSLVLLGIPDAQGEVCTLPGVRLPVASLPLEEAGIPDFELALTNADCADARAVLPVVVLPPGMDLDEDVLMRMWLATWRPLAIRTGLMVHLQGNPTNRLLMAAARVGLLPFRIPFSPEASRLTSRWCLFEQRAFTVRLARKEDVSELAALEKLCRVNSFQADEAQISRRIEEFPEGQFVLETPEGLSGAVFTQRISSEDVLAGRTHLDVHEIHDPHGPVLFLKAVNLAPALQPFGWSEQLLFFVLLYGASMQGIEQIVAVSQFRSYGLHQELSSDEFLALRDSTGEHADPAVRFHETLGAKIGEVLPGYRPNESEGCRDGLIVVYDPVQVMLSMTQKRPVSGASAALDPDKIMRALSHIVEKIIPGTSAGTLSPDAELAELGVDSVLALELRRQVENSMRCQLASSFFETHRTLNEIAGYFVKDNEPQDSGCGT